MAWKTDCAMTYEEIEALYTALEQAALLLLLKKKYLSRTEYEQCTRELEATSRKVEYNVSSAKKPDML